MGWITDSVLNGGEMEFLSFSQHLNGSWCHLITYAIGLRWPKHECDHSHIMLRL